MAAPDPKPRFVARYETLSFAAGVLEKLITNWTSIASYIGGGALMGGLAYIQQVPPLWWGAAFFSGLIFVSLVRAVARWGRSKESLARLYDATAVTPSGFNRLQPEYTRQQIRVSDLIHPLGEPLEEKVFIECEFHGPGLLALSGCHFDGEIRGGNIELVRLKAGQATSIPSKAFFQTCHLRRCKYYNLVIAMPSNDVDTMKKMSGGIIQVVGE